MRDKIIAGNWKMNLTPNEGETLISEVLRLIKNVDLNGKQVIFAPSIVSILPIVNQVKNSTDNSNISVASQNISQYVKGAYTGETSGQMLAVLGVKEVIIGHSERRAYFNETDDILALKVDRALEEGIIPIYCCGEALYDRKNGKYASFIQGQIESGLFHLSAQEISNVIIAYEPVWAIGTGETANPLQAQEVHLLIRDLISNKYGKEIANEIHILYGGSMKPVNAKQLLDMPDIDGGLIGGAALNANDFANIIKTI